MIKLSQKQQKIVSIILEKGVMQSSAIHKEMLKNKEDIALVTVKRILSQMVKLGLLTIMGSARSTSYKVSSLGRIFTNLDANKYCLVEPDKRYGLDNYNFDLFSDMPDNIFDDDELQSLDSATKEYKARIKDLPPAIQRKELERLIVELSWKSSKIEGNTYTLLDTEKLILENKEKSGYDKKETSMILNHKDAFNFVRGNAKEFETLNKVNIEKVHSILVKDLDVGLGFRNRVVGITGSKYHPLDNIYQIEDAIEALSLIISKMQNSYAKAFLALAGVGYIQPFEDGNKRTARLMTNALLLAYGNAPLSYRSIDENDYRAAMLVFYEINSIMPLKNIFIEQYVFACKNYAVK